MDPAHRQSPSVVVQLRLDSGRPHKVDARAKTERASRSQVIRNAIDRYIEAV